MASVSLLHMGDPETFHFEHRMAHRNYFGVMWPLDRFSVLPYETYPMRDAVNASGVWHLDHQQAHDDYLSAVPSSYGTTATGLFIGQLLRDTSFANEDQLTWWMFANHMEHYIANDSVLPSSIEVPLPAPPPPPAPAPRRIEWRYPFW